MKSNTKQKPRQRWKIRVVWSNGDEEFLAQGNQDAIFTSRRAADEMVEQMKMGMDDVQSISVVRA